MPLTVGTAGHIDHGKTWLVRALTGKDTDRLPEEQERGISIDLGYAPLDLPGGRRLSLIDVPGHERFIRNMVAGASGIDLFLLVIDATEGARPQTHEHLAILRLLGIERRRRRRDEGGRRRSGACSSSSWTRRASSCPGAEVVPVSAKTGEGLDELRAALERGRERKEHASSARGDAPLRRPRLHAARHRHRRHGDALVGLGRATATSFEPSRPALDVRVRSVQVHDEPVERAEAGQRVALALPGIERDDLAAGTHSSSPARIRSATGSTSSSRSWSRSRTTRGIQVHHGTAEIAGAARPGRRALRAASPRDAGGRGPRRPRRPPRLDDARRRPRPRPGAAARARTRPPRAAGDGRPGSIVRALVHEPVRADELAARALLSPAQLDEGLAAVEQAGGWHFSSDWLDQLGREARTRLTLRAEAAPLDPGLGAGELLAGAPWADAVLPLLGARAAGRQGLPPGRARRLGEEGRGRGALEAKLEESGSSRSRSTTPSSHASSRSPGPARPRRRRARGRDRRLRGGQARADRGVRASRQDHARPLPRPPRRLAPAGAASAGALRRGRPHAPRRRRARPAAQSYDRTVGSGMGPVAQLGFKTGAVV